MSSERYKHGSCSFYDLLRDLNKYVIQRHVKGDKHIITELKIKYYADELERCFRDKLYKMQEPDFLFRKMTQELEFILENSGIEDFLHPVTVSIVYQVLVRVVEDYTKSAYSHAFKQIRDRAERNMEGLFTKSKPLRPEVERIISEQEANEQTEED